jgi:DNA replication and repair protein RecF
MHLSRLKAQAFRNFSVIDITPQPGINLILGPNASGKTSLLEAIYILGHGRSFKERQMDGLIQFGQNAFTIFAEAQKENSSFACGLSKQIGSSAQIQINGTRTRLLSMLAQGLPLLLISPESFKLLCGSSEERRHFLDWGVFHVEHQFALIWQQYQKVLKQRNAEIKQSAHSGRMKAWDKQLIDLGGQVAQCRIDYWSKFLPICMDSTEALLPGLELEISLCSGWSDGVSLGQALQNSLPSDLMRGFTQVGPHRADIIVKQRGLSAAKILSRGQQKLLVSALYLAAGKFLALQSGRPCIYLLDDVAAELDVSNQRRILKSFSNVSQQIFITGVDQDTLLVASSGMPVTMFHVEQLNSLTASVA